MVRELLDPPRVRAVCTGRPQTYSWLGRELTTSIFKQPVEGPVRVLADHLEGDEQSDLKSHGGVDKAVYVYAEEDVAWWSRQLGRPPAPGGGAGGGGPARAGARPRRPGSARTSASRGSTSTRA